MPRRERLPSSGGRRQPCTAALGNSRRRSAGLARLRRLGRSRLKCMATSTSVPVEEYLRTTYHPDMEYVDGELVERHVGEHTHSRLQTLTVGLLFPLERSRRFRVQEADREGIRYCADLVLETEVVGRVDFKDLFAKLDEATE